jgi:hypothetical protein
VTAAANIEQGGDVLIRLQIDAAPISSIPAIGSTTRHELLTPEADAAVTALAAANINGRFVDEH